MTNVVPPITQSSLPTYLYFYTFTSWGGTNGIRITQESVLGGILFLIIYIKIYLNNSLFFQYKY